MLGLAKRDMTVVGTALSRSAGRVSRRLDRLSERRFAMLVSVPALLLVGLIVLPPTLAVFGLSLFRIELAKDDLRPTLGRDAAQTLREMHREYQAALAI